MGNDVACAGQGACDALQHLALMQIGILAALYIHDSPTLQVKYEVLWSFARDRRGWQQICWSFVINWVVRKLSLG